MLVLLTVSIAVLCYTVLSTNLLTAQQAEMAVQKTNVAQWGGYSSAAAYGQHLVLVNACGDCHTPKKMGARGPEDDSTLLMSGHPAGQPIPDVNRKEVQQKGISVTQTLTAWVGPWGVSYAANITPDESGIGSWTEQQFFTALREGRAKGIAQNRHLLPPMPWSSIRHMSDEELRAVFAYLKSIPPVNNIVPNPQPPVE
ncbi:Cytochrome c [Cnuella takakiae]|uniref:Cytochrome c n=2 Tax=Cnuella takakiae TaxID=1302690 RepID=A0A1M5F8H5_9BACT|nr:Cytochrome c [Cnuella takakiae]